MILFTADWHLKLSQKNVPVSWSENRYKLFFDQLDNICSKVNIHIVGGDIFDRLPSIEELELYFEFVCRSKVPTFIYNGNHEATKKGKTFLSALKQVTKVLNPLVTIIDEVTEYEWGTIVPYCKLNKTVFKDLNKNKAIFTHVRGNIPPHVKAEIDLSLLEEFPVVFAGDLHAHSNTQANIVYPGSPMTTSFHRSMVETGYLLIEEGTNIWEWDRFKLPQLLRKTVSDPKDMIPSSFHHTIYELEGDIIELADIQNTELLDKKIVRRSAEASLILDSSMTIEQELTEYLLYILELPEEAVTSIIGTFRDNFKES